MSTSELFGTKNAIVAAVYQEAKTGKGIAILVDQTFRSYVVKERDSVYYLENGRTWHPLAYIVHRFVISINPTERAHYKAEIVRPGGTESITVQLQDLIPAKGFLTVEDLRHSVEHLIKSKGWSSTPSDVTHLYLMAEVGEVADALLTLRESAGENRIEAKIALGKEMYDVIWNLFRIADENGIDMEQCIREKISENLARTWTEDNWQ